MNVPRAWEPYLKEALENPEIQKQLEIGRFSKTYSGLGIWIIHQFLIEKTSFPMNDKNERNMSEKLSFPELPPDFVKWLKTTRRQIKEIPKDVVEAFKEYQKEKSSEKDRNNTEEFE